MRRFDRHAARRVLAFHREREAVATIGLVECDEVDQYGVVVLDDAEDRRLSRKTAQGHRAQQTRQHRHLRVFARDLRRNSAGTFYDFGKASVSGVAAAARRFTASTRAERIGAISARRANIGARVTTLLRGTFAIPGYGADGDRPIGVDRRRCAHRGTGARRRRRAHRRRRYDRWAGVIGDERRSSKTARVSNAACFGTARRIGAGADVARYASSGSETTTCRRQALLDERQSSRTKPVAIPRARRLEPASDAS